MAEPLDPSGGDIRLGDLTLRTPGIAGYAELTDGPLATATRSPAPADLLIGPALTDHDVVVQHEVVLSEVETLPTTAEVTRGKGGEPEIALDVPGPLEGWGQMVLAIDPAGIATWHFEPEILEPNAPRTYRVRAPGPAPPPEAEGGPELARGVFGVAAQAVIRVLAFRLLDAAAGEVGEYFAGRWETSRRPYRVRSFTPQDYTQADAPTFTADDWKRVGEGRALLFLHGTFSRAHTGFGQLPGATLTELHRRYGGRVLAFDHFTLSEDPCQNVEWLVRAMPDDAHLSLDVVSHSRGGLVARTLAELQREVSLGSRELEVGRVVFAGTPNAGTVLADFDHLGDLIDTYTTLLSFVPDNGVTEVVGTIVTVAKTLAVGAAKGLDGLTAMTPGGAFLARLNGGAGAAAAYFALASDYEPTTAALRAWARNRLTDALFAQAANDLVVPTDGVYAANGSPRFPVTDRHLFGRSEGVSHSGYFTAPAGPAKLLDWLPG